MYIRLVRLSKNRFAELIDLKSTYLCNVTFDLLSILF